jgi:hypothetical protein
METIRRAVPVAAVTGLAPRLTSRTWFYRKPLAAMETLMGLP